MNFLQTLELRALTSIITKGTTPLNTGGTYASQGVPFLRVTNLQGGRVCLESDALFINGETHRMQARSRIYPGDILISIAGSIGRVAFVESHLPEMNCNQAVAIIRPNASINSRYLLHWLQSHTAQLQMRAANVTGTISNLSLTEVGNLHLRVPSPQEQTRIAAILDQADALRTKRRQTLALLKSFPQILFSEMFGPAQSVDWPMRRLSELISGFSSGKSIVANGDEEESVNRVLKVSSVGHSGFVATESKPLPLNYDPPQSHFARHGDLLFSRANTAELVGAIAYVWGFPDNLVLPDKLWRFNWLDDSPVAPLYIEALFRQPEIRCQISQRATGTSGSMKNISQEKVLGLQFRVPPKSLQQLFSDRIKVAQDATESARLALSGSNALFRSLQDQTFSGKL